MHLQLPVHCLTIPENLLTPFLEAVLGGGMGIVAEYDLGENLGEKP